MIKLKRILSLSLFLLAAILVVISACKDGENGEEEEEGSENTSVLTSTGPCLADASWFTTDPNTGNRNTPAPEEGANSVFGDNTTVTNCDFHRWSWQKFLWLTKDVSGYPLFLDSMFQVTPDAVIVPTTNKRIVFTSADAQQATSNILKTNKSYNANNTNYTVYYSIHVNNTLYNSIQKFAPMPDSLYADSTFPVGSLELKIAWVDIAALRDTSNYFITNGSIEGTNTRIALLGMHVVGVVYNHPEFVWATFEHDDLVPYYDWAATTTSDVPVTTSTNYLFFDSTATGTLANIDINSDSTNVFAVNPYGIPRTAPGFFPGDESKRTGEL